MKPVVLAGPVYDITIGRYLAARGTDFILVSGGMQDILGPLLKEWVQGPKLIASLAGGESHRLHETIDGYCGQSVLPYADDKLFFADLRRGHWDERARGRADWFVVSSWLEIEQWNLMPEKCLLEYKEGIKWMGPVAGFIIQTGKETESGAADFEELDKFFEAIGRG